MSDSGPYDLTQIADTGVLFTNAISQIEPAGSDGYGFLKASFGTDQPTLGKGKSVGTFVLSFDPCKQVNDLSSCKDDLAFEQAWDKSLKVEQLANASLAYHLGTTSGSAISITQAVIPYYIYGKDYKIAITNTADGPGWNDLQKSELAKMMTTFRELH